MTIVDVLNKHRSRIKAGKVPNSRRYTLRQQLGIEQAKEIWRIEENKFTEDEWPDFVDELSEIGYGVRSKMNTPRYIWTDIDGRSRSNKKRFAKEESSISVTKTVEDVQGIKIEKGIPVPLRRRGREPLYEEVLKKLEIGDSFVVKDKNIAKYVRLVSTAKKTGVRITTRTIEGGKVRIWRYE